MANIITITTNTAIDFFITVEELTGDAILAESSHDFACGKGINVGKAVTQLNQQVRCLGFVGEQSLAAFTAISSPFLKTDFIAVNGKTRTNITLRATATAQENHIRTAGFSVTAADCQRLLAQLDGLVVAGDVVVISGSLPKGAPENFYQTLIDLCHQKSATVFLDSSGAALREGIKAKPYAIKPNQQELADLTGENLTDTHTIIAAAQAIIAQGVKWVWVSRGADGVLVVGEQGVLSAKLKVLPEPILSHVGCGDALLAGVAVAFVQGLALEDTVKLAVACGTANLFSMEPGQFDYALMAQCLGRVEIEWF